MRLWGASSRLVPCPLSFFLFFFSFFFFFFFFFFLLDAEGTISFGKFGRDAHVSGHAATDLHY